MEMNCAENVWGDGGSAPSANLIEVPGDGKNRKDVVSVVHCSRSAAREGPSGGTNGTPTGNPICKNPPVSDEFTGGRSSRIIVLLPAVRLPSKSISDLARVGTGPPTCKPNGESAHVGVVPPVNPVGVVHDPAQDPVPSVRHTPTGSISRVTRSPSNGLPPTIT